MTALRCVTSTVRLSSYSLFHSPIHSFNLIMFNKFFQSVFTNCSNYVNSTAADSVYVDAINGSATVLYKDGSMYRYTNVSRRAIVKFMLDDARSIGKFINNVLKQPRVAAGTQFILA